MQAPANSSVDLMPPATSSPLVQQVYQQPTTVLVSAPAPAKAFTGTWYHRWHGHHYQASGADRAHGHYESTAWSTSGTGFGVNAASGFAGSTA
jgi:hypothetical protein